MLRYILSPCWHGRRWSTNVEVHFAYSGLVNTHSDIFCFLVDMLRLIFSPLSDGRRLVNAGTEGIGQHKLRYILCFSWYGMGLFNICFDEFCAHAGMEEVWLTKVEIHFVYSLSCSTQFKLYFQP